MDAARAIETFCDVTKGTDVTRCAQIAKSIEEAFELSRLYNLRGEVTASQETVKELASIEKIFDDFATHYKSPYGGHTPSTVFSAHSASQPPYTHPLIEDYWKYPVNHLPSVMNKQLRLFLVFTSCLLVNFNEFFYIYF